MRTLTLLALAALCGCAEPQPQRPSDTAYVRPAHEASNLYSFECHSERNFRWSLVAHLREHRELEVAAIERCDGLWLVAFREKEPTK